MKEIELNIEYHSNQNRILFESDARFKIIAKGRRFGLTKGFANYIIEEMLVGVTPVLWVDTVYGNIERYVERYFIPVLKKLPKGLWKYRINRNELKIGNSVCDFRSADKPENIEGFGYALIVINEAGIVLKNRNLWSESILPMILDYKAKVLIGGTPKGKKVKNSEKHLFYELFQRGMTKNNKKYKSFNFSTYDNPLINKNEIKELEKEMPSHLRDQEIYGLFIDTQGTGIIKREWFKFYDKHEIATKRFYRRIQIWDTAFKANQENDFSVCETWTEMQDGYYLINICRGRFEFPELKRKAKEQYEKYRPSQVWIEDKASGISLIQELKRDTNIPIKEIKADKDKMEYVNAAAPIIEGGRVKLLNNADRLEGFIDECIEFPNGEYDDQVDIMCKYLNETKNNITQKEIKVRFVKRDKLRKKKYQNYRG